MTSAVRPTDRRRAVRRGYPPCGSLHDRQVPGQHRRNRLCARSLRVPGSVYCAGADCTGKSIQNGPGTSDPPSVCTTGTATPQSRPARRTLSSGRIDHPWLGGVEGWQGFPGQNNFLEFGKEPYVPGENGGIKGHVVYASTRPFDDPQMLVQTQWEPLVPHVTINLYQEGFAADGVTPTLTLVDTTQTSSWDDWAQGFRGCRRRNAIPNMNCPGQGAASPAQSRICSTSRCTTSRSTSTCTTTSSMARLEPDLAAVQLAVQVL